MTRHDDEARVGELIETAGARPDIPDEDLDAIVAAARVEWRERWGRGVERRPAARSARRWIAAAALVAATLAGAVGFAAWYRATRIGGEPPAVVARVERVTGPVRWVAEDGEPRELATGDPVPEGATVATGGAGLESRGRVSLRLVGGATVRLDAETSLRLASVAAVELERGAVYVDTGTAEADGGGIEVRTVLGTARDVGTQFTVRAVGGADGTVRVQVREGAVELARGGSTYRAGPGDELVIRGGGPVERREVSPYGRDWEWVIAAAPPFELEGRTLRELLEWVARETGWRVLYEDDALAGSADDITLHGSLGDLRADQAAFTVLPGAGLEAELGGGVLLVRRATGSR